MSETLLPYFWIRRNGDTYVPLIPVDEIPSSIGLRDVSTTKDWEHVCRGEMRFLGDHYDHSGNYYTVDILHPTNDPNEQDSSSTSESPSTTPTKRVYASPAKKSNGPQNPESQGGVDKIQANIDKITAGQEHASEGSQEGSQDGSQKYQGTAGTLGKKVYCTYWIRTGNCNYMQEGCKYKHEIPPDDETRLAIGVRTYPSWPREDPESAPRPPPVKTWQASKPEHQQSWRRQDNKGAQAELSGAQKPSHRVNSPRVSINSSGSSIARFTPSSSAPTSVTQQRTQNGSRHPSQIAVVDATQHFPSHASYLNQQHSNSHFNSQVSPQGNGHLHQGAAAVTAGSYNGHSAHIVPKTSQPQRASLGANAQYLSPSTHQTIDRPPAVQTGDASPQPATTPQRKGNPFTQRVASISHTTASGNAHANALPHLDGSSNYQIVQRPHGQNTGPVDSFPIGSTNTQYASNPFAGAPGVTKPPQYMPTDTQEAPIAKASSNLLPTTHDGDNITQSSTSRVDTPAGPSATAQASFHGNPMTHRNANGSTDIGTRAGTPATVSRSGARHPTGSSSFSSQGIDPAIISVRTQTPLSVKGRGPILFNPTMQQDTNQIAVANESTAQQNSYEDAQSTVSSPPPLHRRMFRAPGEPEYVANPLEEAHSKSQRTTKKQTAGTANGKGRKNGHPGKHHPHAQNKNQDLLI